MNHSVSSVAALTLAAVLGAAAQGAVLFTGVPLSEDFDSLPTSSSSAFFPATVGTPTAVPGTSGWVGTRLDGTGSTMAYTNWFSTTTTSTGSVVGAATLTTDTERALGTLTSASHRPGIGVEIVNASGADIISITISFMQENWRTPGSSASAGNNNGFPNMTLAEYGTTDSGITSATIFTATTEYTNEPNLDLTGAAPTATATAIDGNLAVNRTPRMTTIDLSSTPIGPGESFFLRFNDIDESGTDGIMAIDDFNFNAVVVPEPTALQLAGVGLGGVVLSCLRRRGRAR